MQLSSSAKICCLALSFSINFCTDASMREMASAIFSCVFCTSISVARLSIYAIKIVLLSVNVGKIIVKVKSLIKESVKSPIGEVEVVSNDNGIVSILFSGGRGENEVAGDAEYIGIIDFSNDNDQYKTTAAKQLDEYFRGKRKDFSIALDFQNGTPFQKQVWEEMLRIPYGKTMTYAEIAKKIGRPKAARAVGMACHKNPLCIIVPCHRVVGSGGGLTGYAGGLLKKQWLLAHERSI